MEMELVVEDCRADQSPYWTATLLVPSDGPAVRLCRQQNDALMMPYECVVSEIGLIALAEPFLSNSRNPIRRTRLPGTRVPASDRRSRRSDSHRSAMTLGCVVRVKVSRKRPLKCLLSRFTLSASRREVKRASRAGEAFVEIGRSGGPGQAGSREPRASPRSVSKADAPDVEPGRGLPRFRCCSPEDWSAYVGRIMNTLVAGRECGRRFLRLLSVCAWR